ncbi:hypothetical protein EYR36_010063 [Pleurotus pulmonarius]|nr:hypothetical protein EYR36_010063 [Pleurotus pulmonarius]
MQAHQAELLRTSGYIASARMPSTICWKPVGKEDVLVKDQSCDPRAEPLLLIMVGQVGRGPNTLGPLGSFRVDSKFVTLDKAKMSFDIETPDEPVFAADFMRGMALLQKLEKAVAKTGDIQNLFDGGATTSIRLGAPLFRVKYDDADCEELPDGNIANDPADADYFPTSRNWPVPRDIAAKWAEVATEKVFQPLRVFYHDGRSLGPAAFANTLPGALVEVHFTLHHWHIKSKGMDSFNARLEQIVILKDAPTIIRKSPGVTRGIRRPAVYGAVGEKRPATEAPPSQPSVKKARETPAAVEGIAQEEAVAVSADAGQVVRESLKGKISGSFCTGTMLTSRHPPRSYNGQELQHDPTATKDLRAAERKYCTSAVSLSLLEMRRMRRRIRWKWRKWLPRLKLVPGTGVPTHQRGYVTTVPNASPLGTVCASTAAVRKRDGALLSLALLANFEVPDVVRQECLRAFAVLTSAYDSDYLQRVHARYQERADYVTNPRIGGWAPHGRSPGCRVWTSEASSQVAQDAGRLTIVGSVRTTNHDLGPMGDYVTGRGSLASARRMFTLDAPKEPGFDNDYNQGLTLLRTLMRDADTPDIGRGLLENGPDGQSLKFVAPIFCAAPQKSEANAQPPGFNVSYAWQKRVDEVLVDHAFAAFDVSLANGVAVPVKDVASRLPGSLVAVTFRLEHSVLQGSARDFFCARVERVVILREAAKPESKHRPRTRTVTRGTTSGPGDRWFLKGRGSEHKSDDGTKDLPVDTKF